ncbi:MAG: HU family DNA-binding protein [Bacteroidales bacterium]|nr:HU family DNA-binding protein [Bacteroidales bacterium]
MAIDIEWQTLPTPNNNDDNKPLLYPRMTDNGIVDFQTLCELTAQYGSYTRGTVKSITSDLMEIIAKLLSEGKTIDIAEFGTFRLAIGAEANVSSDTPYHKRPITVRGVNFQPDKALMDAIGTPDFLSVPRNAPPVAMTVGQIEKVLLEYFKTHDSITRAQFEELCQLKRTTAYGRLKELMDSGFLKQVGHNKETKYELGLAHSL